MYVNQIFTLKQLVRKPERKNVECMDVGFIDLEKAYNRVNKEALWQVLRIYEGGVNCWVEFRVCMLVV